MPDTQKFSDKQKREPENSYARNNARHLFTVGGSRTRIQTKREREREKANRTEKRAALLRFISTPPRQPRMKRRALSARVYWEIPPSRQLFRFPALVYVFSLSFRFYFARTSFRRSRRFYSFEYSVKWTVNEDKPYRGEIELWITFVKSSCYEFLQQTFISVGSSWNRAS